MFMIARQGTRAWPTRLISSRTPCEPYCASCMPSTTRSNSPGCTAPGSLAESDPGSFFDEISTGEFLPLMGKRTRVPSLLISSAVGFVHTSETRCPAMSNFVLNNEPYDAPRMSMLYFTIGAPASDRTLLVRGLDFLVTQTKNRAQNFFGMLTQ